MTSYQIKQWALNEEKKKQNKLQQVESQQQRELKMKQQAAFESNYLLPSNYKKTMIYIGVLSCLLCVADGMLMLSLSKFKNIDALQGTLALGFVVAVIGMSTSLFMFSIVPSVIAYNKQHTYKELITVFNVLLGGTIIGWILAFMFATDRSKHNK